MVIVIVVVVWVGVVMYIIEEQNLCWSHSQTCTWMTTEFSVGNSRSSSYPAYTYFDYLKSTNYSP